MSKDYEVRNAASVTWRTSMAVATLTACSALAACSTGETDFRPLISGASVGYSDQQLSIDRVRVYFSGSGTSTESDVQNYLLRRAAEITLQRGYTHFVLEGENIQGDTYRVPGFISDTYLHGPMYAYRVRYWSDYPEAWEGKETRYSAQADILMRLSYEVAGNPNAIEAASVFRIPGPPPLLPVPPVVVAAQ
jgi:hypothetical protein